MSIIELKLNKTPVSLSLPHKCTPVSLPFMSLVYFYLKKDKNTAIQSNLFIVDFRGPFGNVHYKVVHYIETFLQKNVLNNHGTRKKSLIARSPLKRGLTIINTGI